MKARKVHFSPFNEETGCQQAQGQCHVTVKRFYVIDFCSHGSDAKLLPIILTLKYKIGFINKYCKSAVI